MYCVILWALETVWTSLSSFFFNYQTLVAGILAVAAAGLAGAPVWQQLRMMRAQTEAGFRQIIVERLTETGLRAAKVKAFVVAPLQDIGRETEICAPDEVPDIDPEWAFHMGQIVTGARRCIEDWAATHRDIEPVESAKAKLVLALQSVEDVLDDIHRPDSVTMMNEDEDIPDATLEQWRAESREAMGKLDIVAGAANRAFVALEVEYRKLRDALNLRLRQIDDQIIKGR